jgi:HEAT repeat protein
VLKNKILKKKDNPFLKTAILKALGERGTPEAIDFIEKSLDSEESIVRMKAKEILQKAD